MSIEIFYYSGTGFTLKAAKKAAELLEGEVKMTPIKGVMNSKIRESTSEKIGLFFPMHAFGLPLACIEFLKTFRFLNADYIFSAVTRGGAPTRMHCEIDSYLHKQGLSLNAFTYLTTPNTFDIIYKIHEDSDMREARASIDNDIKIFTERVNQRENFIDKGYRNRFFEIVFFPFLKWLNRKTGFFRLQNDFYSDDSCTGCGICSKLCLSNKIKMKHGRPQWQKNIQCDYCLACIQLCPEKAVQVKNSKTPELDRIFCEDVGWKEIADQKSLQ